MLIDTLGASISKESNMIHIILAQLQWLIQITTAKQEFGRVNRNLSSESRGLGHVHFGFDYLHAVIDGIQGRW